MTLLDADLTVSYPGRDGVLRDFRLQMKPGEVCALAGESGSGKSTFALAVLGLLDGRSARVSGRLRFDGLDLLALREREWRALRGRQIAYVPQNPVAALNPYRTLGSQFREAWQAHEPARAGQWREASLQALRDARLNEAEGLLELYPGQLSTGMAQRVMIAMALLHRAGAGRKLLLADEATSALDVINAAGILELFGVLHREQGVSILFITHDLLAAAAVSQRVAVLHGGTVVEEGTPEEVFRSPRHEYTRALTRALAPVAPGAPAWRPDPPAPFAG